MNIDQNLNQDKDSNDRKRVYSLTHVDENESLSVLLKRRHTAFTDKIHALRVINTLSHNMMEDYLSLVKEKFFQKVKSNLNEYEKFDQCMLSLEIEAGTSPHPEDIITSPKVAKSFEDEKKMYHNREDIRRASKEMMLVYLIIIFEEFLSNILTAIFVKEHDSLKSSKKSITYEEVLQHTTLYELITSMSKKEAKTLVESSIEQLNDSLNSKFNLNLSQRDDWSKFKEFFHRRNIVVHNYGVPDSKYIENTKKKVRTDDWLEIDNQYIKEAFDIFESYSKEIVDFFPKIYL